MIINRMLPTDFSMETKQRQGKFSFSEWEWKLIKEMKDKEKWFFSNVQYLFVTVQFIVDTEK